MNEAADELKAVKAEEHKFFFWPVGNGKFTFEYPTEFDQELNDVTRLKIAAYTKKFGEGYLGNVNLHKEHIERKCKNNESFREPILWKWDGQLVCNFEATFIVPCFNQVLVDLIRTRAESEYTGAKDDYARVTAIHDIIDGLGGEYLNWV